jgi:protein involved in sex pheromone biosynthesis
MSHNLMKLIMIVMIVLLLSACGKNVEPEISHGQHSTKNGDLQETTVAPDKLPSF